MGDAVEIIVSASPGSRLQFHWGLGSELYVNDVYNPNTCQGGDSGYWVAASWGGATASHRVTSFDTMEQYAELQRARQSGARAEAYLAFVASYARAVRERLQIASEVDNGDDDGLGKLEAALWQLLELFFVDAPRNEGNLGEDFVHWVAAHGDSLAEVAGTERLEGQLQALLSDPSADTQPEYWRTVERLVALGRTREALQLLEAHGARRAVAAAGPPPPGLMAQIEYLDCLHVLLKRLPRLAPSSRRDPTSRAYASLAEFAAARGPWVRETNDIAGNDQLYSRAAAASRRTADGIRSVLSVLQGQPAALRGATLSWLEGAVAAVVHRQAGGVAAANQLRALLSGVRSERPGESNGVLDLVWSLMQPLMEADIAGVVSELTTCGVASPWLMAHCLELLAGYPGAAGGGGGRSGEGVGGGGGLLTRRLAVSGCDQMEYFRMAWAETLLPNCLWGGWRLALSYLAWCPQHGAAAAEALLEALPVDSRDVRTIDRALLASRRLGLPTSGTVLCRVAGLHALNRGQLGAGVQWLVRGGDPRRTTAALQLVGTAVEGCLLARLGVYSAGALVLPAGDELEALLEWMPGAGVGAVGGGEEEGAGEGGGGGLTGYLKDVLRLSKAMGALGAARESKACNDDPKTRGALSLGRAALMSMVRRRSPPRRLALPLLFYAIPLLEATLGAAPLFTLADLKLLLQWADECGRAAGAGGFLYGTGGGGAGGVGARGLGALAVTLGVSERYARDVQLALVRAMARTDVLTYSGGGGGDGGGWGAGGGGGGRGPAGGGLWLLGAPAAAVTSAGNGQLATLRV